MTGGHQAQDLIQTFLEAIRLRHYERCQTILRSLESLARQHSTLQSWCVYFQGYLVFEFQRDWAEAERIFTDLLQTELEPELQLRVLYALGRSFNAQGRWGEAIAACTRSLSIATELDQTLEKARAWKHIALSYYDGFIQGDFDSTVLQQAVAHCQLALEVLDTVIDPSPDIVWLKGTIWNNLGLIHVSLGQWDEAIVCYQKDLAICSALDDRHGLGLSYGNLAEVYQKCGNWSEALAAYQQALEIIRQFDNRYDETEALTNLAFLHHELGEYELAFDYYSQAIQVIENLRANISSEAAQAGFFGTVVDTYANMVLLCLAASRPEQAFNIVEQARSRAFLDMLAAGVSPASLSRQTEAVPITLAEVQAALPADALLLEYFTTGLVETPEGRATAQSAQRHRFPPARTLIFAVTHNELQVHDAGFSPNDLRPRQLDSVVERHFLDPFIRRALYERLISSIEKLLQGKRRLYLAPHGPLHYIPFQALIAPDDETLLREGGPQLIYGPSATLLFRYGRQAPSQAPASCLALGYNGQGTTRLRFAEGEAQSVARLTGGQALIGPAPKKMTLYGQAANYRLLHFSCHGEFNTESPLASALRLAPDETLTGLDVLEHLRLRCDLITLSACESGLSRVRRGDELVGFGRAFIYAGAPALVSTLWRVDERSTRILMEKFFQEIGQGLDFAAALTQAQLYLKNLTRQEVLDILVRISVDESLDSRMPPTTSWSTLPDSTEALSQTEAYLKGLAKPGSNRVDLLLEGEDEEKIFEDPFYWAPFILIGAPEGE